MRHGLGLLVCLLAPLAWGCQASGWLGSDPLSHEESIGSWDGREPAPDRKPHAPLRWEH